MVDTSEKERQKSQHRDLAIDAARRSAHDDGRAELVETPAFITSMLATIERASFHLYCGRPDPGTQFLRSIWLFFAKLGFRLIRSLCLHVGCRTAAQT